MSLEAADRHEAHRWRHREQHRRKHPECLRSGAHRGGRRRMCFKAASIVTRSAMLARMLTHAMAACPRRYWRRAASDDAPPAAQALARAHYPSRDDGQ